MKKMIYLIVLLLSISINAEEVALKKVAIIGGGMSGVATSAFLRDKKLEIHLFEKEAKLGGHVRTFPLPGLNGKTVNVDVGPQYVNPVGWAIYVDFLKYFGLWDLKNFFKFKQSMTIFNEDAKYPSFITPGGETTEGYKWFREVDTPVKRISSLLKFMSKAHKHQQIPGEKPYISMQEFLDKNKIDKKFQDDIIKPLIATGFTAPLNRVGEVAVTTVAGVLAFQSPLKPAYWYVSKSGLQPYIESIASKLKIQNPQFHIHLATPVTKVSKNENGTYKVFYGEEESMDVDYVVFSTHVPVVAEILKDYKAFDGIWDSMPYTYNKVVIHTDREAYMDSRFPAFYNVKVRKDKTVGMAMNLEMISKDFGPLLKSWGVSESEYNRMKKEGKIVAESDFMHPLQTISFLEGLRKLKAIGKQEGNIFFTGGWSMDFETQFNAVLSGYLAASAITPNIRFYWQSMMPSLKDK
jgi:predicted NAD/FAD-binding protein